MSDPTNVFEGENKEVTPPNNTPTDPLAKYADQLRSIKNESGEQKYDTLDKALDALRHSQEFIPELRTKLTQKEQEVEELRGKVSQFENIEDVVARLAQRKPEGEGNPPAASGLDEKAVLELVQKTLVQSRQNETLTSNMETVSKTLRQKYGDKSEEVVAAKAAELGMTAKELGELAAKSPALVLKHFDAEHKSINPTGAGHNIPPINKPNTAMPVPTKPLLTQGTTQERKDHMEAIRLAVYAQHGVTK